MKSYLRIALFICLSITANVLLSQNPNLITEYTNTDESEIVSRMAKAHIPFIINEGQSNEKIMFYASTFGGTVFITKDGEIVYSLPKTENNFITGENNKGFGVAIKEEFVSGNIKEITGEEKSITQVNVFKGNDPLKWRNNISTFGLVNLGEVFKGINIKLKAYGNNIEKLFFVNALANPKDIRIKMSGLKKLKINNSGELEGETCLGVITFTKPLAYQEKNGNKTMVEVEYAVNGDEYGFKVGDYNRENMLIIDPLLASTFLGGSGADYANSIILDGGGNVYVAGYTGSEDFPTSYGAYDESFNGNLDVFITKMDNDLTTIYSSTFIGGSDVDRNPELALDENGNVYVAGKTFSSDFPTTAGAYDESFNGLDEDIFISKFSDDLTNLIASTYLGGTGDFAGVNIGDTPNSIIIGGNGNVCVAGYTDSEDFPITPNAYDDSYNGGYLDVFIAKLNSDLTSLLASTFLGGDNDDNCVMAIDTSGNIYVAGGTHSLNFPSTPGAYNENHSGNRDAFVSKFDSNLTTLLSSTFLGGNSTDEVFSIIIDESENVYIAGHTASTSFPTITGAYSTIHHGSYDGFVSRLNSDLTTLIASTFLGGNRRELINSLISNGNGNIYVSGSTQSSDFPVTPGAYEENFDGSYYIIFPGDTIYYSDIFVSRLNYDLSNLSASTYIGGENDDYARSVILDESGNVYITGSTGSSDYPTTPGSYNESPNGSSDVFISKLDSLLSADSITGIVRSTDSDNLQIFPNPSDGSFNVKLTLQEPDQIDIQIFNLLNKLVYEKMDIPVEKEYREDIHLQSHPAGLYYVLITGESTRIMKKVILQ